jgi:antibiotic biosynthesis monooxygenase (ABM) superfamily enzyme
MIWLAVFPTLTVLNLALGDWLRTLIPVVRTFVLATIAVPIVIYALMPQLHRLRARLLRARLLTRIASSRTTTDSTPSASPAGPRDTPHPNPTRERG